MQQLLEWLESTALAQSVGQSLILTGGLSALHVVGFTFVMSAGVVWSARAAGLLLAGLPVESIAKPAFRLSMVGLSISVLTGACLFAPRATSTAPNGVFQLKMALLLLAATVQVISTTTVLGRTDSSVLRLRTSGLLGLLSWLALAVAACWFILFE